MSAQPLILDHDKWRKGLGGAPAGVAGQSDGNGYAGLDLDLITFSASSFSGARFSATTFRQADWSECRFAGCAFSQCDFSKLRMADCTFSDCIFESSSFDSAEWSGCTFERCTWRQLVLDNGRWQRVKLLQCKGSSVQGADVQGEQIDWTGSEFQDMELANARIN